MSFLTVLNEKIRFSAEHWRLGRVAKGEDMGVSGQKNDARMGMERKPLKFLALVPTHIFRQENCPCRCFSPFVFWLFFVVNLL
jgi:hypothetical protein